MKRLIELKEDAKLANYFKTNANHARQLKRTREDCYENGQLRDGKFSFVWVLGKAVFGEELRRVKMASFLPRFEIEWSLPPDGWLKKQTTRPYIHFVDAFKAWVQQISTRPPGSAATSQKALVMTARLFAGTPRTICNMLGQQMPSALSPPGSKARDERIIKGKDD